MKKNGFTLVELLAVIVILAIIMAITTFSVNTIINNSKESLSESQIHNIEVAAETYYLKEGMAWNVTCINISELINKGYIEGNSVKNPETREEMTGSVKISYEANQYSYEYKDEACKVCTYEDLDNSGTINLGDTVTCGTESFHVMSNDGSNVTMLSMYNLNVGDNKYPNEETYGIQDEHVYGIKSSYTTYGNVAFSTSNYWLSIATTYPLYVYDKNADIIYPYVSAYETYLKETLKVNSASATLMSYEQVMNMKDNQGNPSWLYNTSYWFGYAYSSDSLMCVNSLGNISANTFNIVYYGVRPVVTISVNEIK